MAELLVFVAIFCVFSSLCNADPKTFPLLAQNIDKTVESSDPIHADVIEFDTPNLQMKFTNATLNGFKGCRTTKLEVQEDAYTFSFCLECPRMIAEAKYELSGKIQNVELDKGEGDFKIELTNYDFIFKGKYDRVKGVGDHDYIQIADYTLETDLRGTVNFYFGHLHGVDRKDAAASKKFFEENSVAIEKTLRKRPTTILMAVFVKNLNNHLKTVSAHSLGFLDRLKAVPAKAVEFFQHFKEVPAKVFGH